jgi:opacity protein-like surface antigen
MPSLHSKWTACLVAVTFVFGIAGNASAATNPMTLNDLSQMVLGLKEEVDRLSKANKTLSKKLERIESQRYAAGTPSSAYQMGNPERLIKARLSEPVRVASLGTTRVAEKKPTREAKASDLENRITALEKQSHSEIRPYVRYDLAFGNSDLSATGGRAANENNQPEFESDFYPLSLGVGLRFTPHIRTDLTFDYYSKDMNVPDALRPDDDIHLQNIVVLANGYYDFSSIGRFTPYVGAGLGFSHFWGEVKRVQIQRNVESLAVAGMAGLNVRLWRSLSADIGYRYAHLGFVKIDPANNTQAIRVQRHDFRMGLRYAF